MNDDQLHICTVTAKHWRTQRSNSNSHGSHKLHAAGKLRDKESENTSRRIVIRLADKICPFGWFAAIRRHGDPKWTSLVRKTGVGTVLGNINIIIILSARQSYH